MYKKIEIVDEAPNYEAVRKFQKVVTSTLGPNGRYVIIHKEGLKPIITKDGVTIANEYELTDPVEFTPIKILKEAAALTLKQAGDGTTTTILLATDLYMHLSEEILDTSKEEDSGFDIIDYKTGVESAVTAAIQYIRDNECVSVENVSDTIFKIARVSTNDDIKMAETISQAISLSNGGAITTGQNKFSDETLIEVTHGMKLDTGYLNNMFVNKPESLKIELENAKVLVIDSTITSINQLKKFLEAYVGKYGSNTPLVLFANSFPSDSSIVSELVLNLMNNVVRIYPFQIPELGDHQREVGKDIAAFTNSVYITTDSGIHLDTIDLKHLGNIDNLIADYDTCNLIVNEPNQDLIEHRLSIVHNEFLKEKQADNEYRVSKLMQRITALNGKAINIKVAAHSDTELKEKKDRLDDGIAACRAALEEGVVLGGGSAYYRAANHLLNVLDLDDKSPSFVKGFVSLAECLFNPFDVLVRGLNIDSDILDEMRNKGTVLNVKTKKIERIGNTHIFDPFKVTRIALQNAASVALTLALTGSMIVKSDIDFKNRK